jgi:hypothetical protein
MKRNFVVSVFGSLVGLGMLLILLSTSISDSASLTPADSSGRRTRKNGQLAP